MNQLKKIGLHTTFTVAIIAFVIGIAYISFEIGRMVGDGEGWREATEATNLPSVSEINNLASVCSQL
jgi:hypothetical protein